MRDEGDARLYASPRPLAGEGPGVRVVGRVTDVELSQPGARVAGRETDPERPHPLPLSRLRERGDASFPVQSVGLRFACPTPQFFAYPAVTTKPP